MPLPSGYVTTEDRQSANETKSPYFSASDIEENTTAELIICGEPDDHMIAGWLYWTEDGPAISRTEPDQAEWIANAKPAYGITKTKEEILDIINNATNKKEEWEGIKLLDRRKYFLAFAAYHVEREEFVCVKVEQSTILKPLESYLAMEEDYMPITKDGIYNCRVLIAKKAAPDESGKKRISYEVTVRVHRPAEKKEVQAIQAEWEKTKDGMWLPRYFMAKGENNVFEGKPVGGALPAGLPTTARDEYGAETELKGF